MKLQALGLLLLSGICFESQAKCLDPAIDPKTESAARKAATSFLDPKNQEVVPPGLPDMSYPHRKLVVIQTIQGNALVFVVFRAVKGEPGFSVPYSFVSKSKSLEKVFIPNHNNGGSRLWNTTTQIISRCRNPEIRVTFDACFSCGTGLGLSGRFGFDETSSNWSFWPDQQISSDPQGVF